MRHHLARPALRLLTFVTGVCVLAGVSLRAQQAAPAAAPPLPNAKDIVAKHLAAIGGEAAFKAVKSVHAKGTFELPAQGIKGDLEVIAARPNKMINRVEIPGVGHAETGYDGKVAWSIDPLEGPKLLTGRALTEIGEDAWFDGALHASDRVKELTTIAKVEFDKRPAYQIKVVHLSGVEQMEYYDVETGLQLGSESQRETPMGVLPVKAMLRDYTKFAGLLQPTVLVQSTMGMDQVLRISSYEYNTVVATAFDPPPAIKALIK
jgi:hypothetical protein